MQDEDTAGAISELVGCEGEFDNHILDTETLWKEWTR